MKRRMRFESKKLLNVDTPYRNCPLFVEGKLVRSAYLFGYLYALRDSFPIIKKKEKKKRLQKIALRVIPGRKVPLCQGLPVSRSVVEKFQVGFAGNSFSCRKLSVITGRDRDFTFLRKYHCTNGNASLWRCLDRTSTIALEQAETIATVCVHRFIADNKRYFIISSRIYTTILSAMVIGIASDRRFEEKYTREIKNVGKKLSFDVDRALA